MQCKSCKKELEYQHDYRNGKHAEYLCPCGQFLQWDYEFVEPTGHGSLRLGNPQQCIHEDKIKPGASLPIF